MVGTASKRSHDQSVEIDDVSDTVYTPKRSKPTTQQPETVTLDPDGDVILALTEERYLVSSKVLGSASPVFSKMFSPQFSEGNRVRKGEVPCITLEDDDFEIMDIILRILHFDTDSVLFQLSRKKFASIAIHSDKYDLKRALRGWVGAWWHANKFDYICQLSNKDLGYTLLAAYMFRFKKLPELAAKVVEYLTPGYKCEWEQHEQLVFLPNSLIAAVEDSYSSIRSRLHKFLESQESTLQGSRTHPLPRSHCMECIPCGKIYPAGAPPCVCGKPLADKYCTADFRVATYFKLLKKAQLYPFSEVFGTCSLRTLSQRVEKFERLTRQGDSIFHYDDPDDDCPLRLAGTALTEIGRASWYIEPLQWSYT